MDSLSRLTRGVGPSFVNTDLSLIKDTKITERLNLQFRADAFGVFNHPNFDDPNLTVGSRHLDRLPARDFRTAISDPLANFNWHSNWSSE